MAFVHTVMVYQKELKNLKMLSPRLSDCIECSNIISLLDDIDCKLAELAQNEYNNIVFSLNYPVQGITIGDLLNYKRILTYKLANKDYASCYTVNMIASRVKLLTAGATNCCSKKKILTNSPGTTTTTTSITTMTPITTTTTSSTTSAPQQLVPISLTFAGLGGCAASCGLDPATFYVYTTCYNNITTNNAFNILDCVIYQDAGGTTTGLNGWYSTRAGLCLTVGSYNNGVITGVGSC
jgi:hypothetical protein